MGAILRREWQISPNGPVRLASEFLPYSPKIVVLPSSRVNLIDNSGLLFANDAAIRGGSFNFPGVNGYVDLGSTAHIGLLDFSVVSVSFARSLSGFPVIYGVKSTSGANLMAFHDTGTYKDITIGLNSGGEAFQLGTVLNTWHSLVFVKEVYGRLWSNGIECIKNSSPSLGGSSGNSCLGQLNPGSLGNDFIGNISLFAVFNAVLPAHLAQRVSANPWSLFQPVPRRLWFTPTESGSSHNLAIANAVQGNTASSGAISQTHELEGGAATQANSAESDAVAQTHALLIDNAAQGNAASTGAISQGDPLTAANLAQGNTAQASGITQTHALSASNLAQAQAVDTGAIAQTHGLSGANAAQGNAASAGAISQVVEHNLTISASIQANSADDASVDQTHVLVITASIQSNAGTSVSITQVHALDAGDWTQANLLDNASLSNDLLVDSPVQQNAFSSGSVTVPQYLSAGSWEQGNFISAGALRADIIFESSLLTGQRQTVRIKKPGIPTDAPEWLRTLLETLTGRRNNKIEVPKEPNLTFSSTPTKAECEKLFVYTNAVRSTLEKLINRMDT